MFVQTAIGVRPTAFQKWKKFMQWKVGGKISHERHNSHLLVIQKRSKPLPDEVQVNFFSKAMIPREVTLDWFLFEQRTKQEGTKRGDENRKTRQVTTSNNLFLLVVLCRKENSRFWFCCLFYFKLLYASIHQLIPASCCVCPGTFRKRNNIEQASRPNKCLIAKTQNIKIGDMSICGLVKWRDSGNFLSTQLALRFYCIARR